MFRDTHQKSLCTSPMYALARALATDTGLCAAIFATPLRAAVYADCLAPVSDQVLGIFGTTDPGATQVSDLLLQFNVRSLLNDRLIVPAEVAHLCVIVDYVESGCVPRALSVLETRSPQHTLLIVQNQ